jgi:hypothetical protein
LKDDLIDLNENLDSDDEHLSVEYNIKGDEGIYPHANIKVDREQYSIFELNRKYTKNQTQLILDPDFQREFVWTLKQKSELIESVLMGIPLPMFYLNETKDGKLVVVDGRQRLSTFFSFMNNEFKLKELRILPELNGKDFDGLNGKLGKLQANLEDFQIIAQVIKPPTPDRIKFDIFDRVNRGGTSLNQQEMRNALYQGKSTVLLKKMSESKCFKDATSSSINTKRMKDRYIILRFLSFYLLQNKKLVDANGEFISYRNDIDEFLGKSMEYINTLSDEEIRKLEDMFKVAMVNNFTLFGQNAFRRTSYNGQRNPVNMILFEAFGYLFSGVNQKACARHKEKIRGVLEDFLLSDELNGLLLSDRGRGIVIPKVFDMIDELKERFLNDIENSD